MHPIQHRPPREFGYLLALVFLQMLPATLLVPGIRPLFATYHGGNESAMHAFMSVNMAGAAVVVPFIAALADRMRSPVRLAAALMVVDGGLLCALGLPLPTSTVLGLRFLEGAAHVGAATVLLAHSVSYCSSGKTGRTMGAVGAGIIGAIVLGSALGGILVTRLGVSAPFLTGGAVALIASAMCAGLPRRTPHLAPPRTRGRRGIRKTLSRQPGLWVPISAAFVGRFTVGCLVVTFALFAHRHHRLSDAAIGGLFSLLTLPFAIAMYPMGRFYDRLPGALLLAGGAALYGACLVGVGYAPTGALPVTMFGAGLASAVIYAGTLCFASELAPAGDRAGTMGLVNIAGCVGMLLGPIVAGVVTAIAQRSGNSVSGYRSVFLIAAGSVGLWLLAAGPWLYRRSARDRASRSTSLQPAFIGHKDPLEVMPR